MNRRHSSRRHLIPDAWVGTLILILASAAAALGQSGPYDRPKPGPPGPKRAIARLAARPGSTVAGTVRFTLQGVAGIKIEARVTGAPPGVHGFHVHETGDCSAAEPAFAKAGGHFNPEAHPHAGPDSAVRHAGDLGNLEVAADGTGSLDTMTTELALSPGANSVIGKALIFHEGADDFTTQPTGNAGGRLACGVVIAD